MTASLEDQARARLIQDRDRLVLERAVLAHVLFYVLNSMRRVEERLAKAQTAGEYFGVKLPYPPIKADPTGFGGGFSFEFKLGAEIVNFAVVKEYIDKQTSSDWFPSGFNAIEDVKNYIEEQAEIFSPNGIDEIEVVEANDDSNLTIADIAIDMLRESGDEGVKSSDIKKQIIGHYGREIHEKSVGMTLYRLAQEGKVHRRGRTWFLGSAPAGDDLSPREAESPGD